MSRRSPRPAASFTLPAKVDVAVVGAGVVGLAHAVEAHARGLSVLVLDRDPRAEGTSVRGLGHVAPTTQDGLGLAYALAARERWLKLGREAGFWVRETGSVIVARARDELAVLDDFVATRDGDARLLDAAQVREHVPLTSGDVVGGAFCPLDLRIDPRDAVAALARRLESLPGADVSWSTAVHAFEPGSGCTLLRTSLGDVVAKRVVVAVGHHVGHFFPALAADSGLTRVDRRVLRVAAPGPVGATADDAATPPLAAPTVLGGTALLHEPAFVHSPALADVRERLRTRHPALLDAKVHLVFTARADGSLLLGHAAAPPDPADSERVDDLLLREASALLGVPALRVLGRWSAPDVETPVASRSRRVAPHGGHPFLVAEPMPGVRVVTIPGGNGTTTALGLAPKVLDELA